MFRPGKDFELKVCNGFNMPPLLYNEAGRWRSVGFELEFSGLTIEQAGKALEKALGGELQQESVAKSVLHVEELGTFNIEIDWNYLKVKAAEEAEGQQEPSQWLDLLKQSAAILVPVEIVCPPIPLDRLESLSPMIASLRESGAVGTDDSMIAAYGLHINAEIPRLDATTLFAFLRAFSLLQWWLVDEHKVAFSRKLSPYIDLYPESYLNTLFSCSGPSMDQLMSDYLAHNASRNRALDMLPLFSEIDDGRVSQAVDDDKIQGRPAFHYRLPDCRIEQPEWSLQNAWNCWLIVEQLAEKSAAMEMLGEKFLSMERPLLGVSRRDWTELIDQWISDQLLA